MADITNLYKATVKALKSRQKAQGINTGPDKSILPTTKKSTDFGTKSKLVVSNITKLKEFLLEHRAAYLSATSALGMGTSKMTDAERDQIDADAEIFIKTCSDAIKSFKDQVNGNNVTEQVKGHREAVVSLVEFYLKEVCKIYSEQKAIRVKRVVDRKRIGRLQPEGKRSKSSLNTEPDEKGTEDGKEKEDVDVNNQPEGKEKTEQRVPDFDEPPIKFDDDDEISPEEAQMFEEENQELYDEMNSLVDEVKQIEGKVVEISRLQEIFADKVLEQEADIDRIADTVVGATENIKDANEEIREAMKNNAGLRVWILFFLIVCSFSLLFLDWYNA